ncbi:hypothetical protein [Embleya sp. AB8]|uniref:hypothetical protein n=1 Tax=Embleya sp. AB8 TaxID=3156304 RepID=UPI003C78E459
MSLKRTLTPAIGALALAMTSVVGSASTAHADPDFTICNDRSPHQAAYNYKVVACLTVAPMGGGIPDAKLTRSARFRGGSTDVRMGFAVLEAPADDLANGWYISYTFPSGNLTLPGNGQYSGSISDGDPSTGSGGVTRHGYCYWTEAFFTESGRWHYGAVSSTPPSRPYCT